MERIVAGFTGLNDDIQHPINQMADATTVIPGGNACAGDRSVWTAIDKDGNLADHHCEGWQSASVDHDGHGGHVDAMNEQWTSVCVMRCDLGRRLYCFQQAP